MPGVLGFRFSGCCCTRCLFGTVAVGSGVRAHGERISVLLFWEFQVAEVED